MVSSLVAAFLALGWLGTLAPADEIRFGDPASEATHEFAGAGCPVHAGALGEKCRRIAPGGALVFSLRCDPTTQNYLTLKLWGSDRDVATLFLFNGQRRVGDYLGEWPELDLCKGEAGFPGRFYLVTYPLPREMTDGKTRVLLRIAAVGSINPYASDPASRERPQNGPTRGVYRAWVHTDPFLPTDWVGATGSPPDAPTRALPEGFSAVAELNRQADAAVERLRRWEIYGADWDAAMARGDVPPVVRGAVARPLRPEKRDWAAWLDLVSTRTHDGNSVALNVLAVYALAWASPASRWRGDPELLDRVVAGLDFYCRAQGANGAFNARAGWVGGPARKKAGSCLEGFGTAGLGQAFVVLADTLQQQGLLEVLVDEDADPATPPVARRLAYATMFERHRDFLASPVGRGHATNQDLAQMTALWLSNEALRRLAPERAWPRAEALRYVRSAVGLERDPLGGYWVTRKGLALEPWGTLGGGYCGNYGLMAVGQLCRLAELTEDPAVRERALRAVQAAAR
ncbi:MAG: hypothetical protein QHJ73_09820, partial [Armatimonadota bacterium]|nr:hypothetical protein [Armatimonadota bacterium]